jgi:hypothetical protein
MLCPICHALCSEDDLRCTTCGAELVIPASRSLVVTGKQAIVTRRAHLPDLLRRPPLQQLAAGVGALAVGVGIELLRRKLLSWLAHAARGGSGALPPLALPGGRHLPPSPVDGKLPKLPRGYEVQEIVVYMQRTIRRRH